MGLFSCCGGGGVKEPRKHRSRRHRRKHRNAVARTSIEGAVAGSTLSDNDYQDARDAFSEAGDLASPSFSHSLSPRASGALGRDYELGSGGEDDSCYNDDGEASTTGSGSEDEGIAGRLVSCLNVLRATDSYTDGQEHAQPRRGAAPSRSKPPAGSTLPRRPPSVDAAAARRCWDECDATTVSVRSLQYMRTKQKVASGKAIYRLAGIDVYGTPQKAFHVARSMQLPPAPPPVVLPGGAESTVLPPLLVMNIQLPSYPAAFFGANDGPGLSVVLYFMLPEDFDPSKVENQRAMGLLQRFVANGREADGNPTRERLKLIARVVNVDEWVSVAQMSGTEQRLLTSYNEKPVLSRPQHTFYVGPNYLEVDLDVHNYAYLARKALNGYHTRLKDVVWDVAFVLQGNAEDELPEQVLGCGRVYRTDLALVPSLEDSIAAMGLTTGEAMPLPVERPSHGSPQPNGTVAAASAAAPPA